jgi:hypothetical protein
MLSFASAEVFCLLAIFSLLLVANQKIYTNGDYSGRALE